jgi:hypothetical protein
MIATMLSEDLVQERTNALSDLLISLKEAVKSKEPEVAQKAQETLARLVLSLYEAELHDKAIEAGLQIVKKLPKIEDI